MKINFRLLLGFLLIIILIIGLALMNSSFNQRGIVYTEQIREIDAPLNLMTQQILTYDSLLTAKVLQALSHAQNSEWLEVEMHEQEYLAAGNKLDNLLKKEARELIEKSQRTEEIKEEIYSYLDELDRINLALVRIETVAFSEMEIGGDLNLAEFSLRSDEYHKHKNELVNILNDWQTLELELTSNVREIIIEEREFLLKVNFGVSFFIILLSLFISYFIAASISKPIKKLTKKVDLITRGNLEVQLDKTNLNEVNSLTSSLNRILASMKLAILRTGASKSELGLGKLEKAKEEAEIKYKKIFEESPDAIILLDKKGNVLESNGRLKEWLDYDLKEIIGKNLLRLPFLSFSSKKIALKNFYKRLKGDEVKPYELEFKDKKGKIQKGIINAVALKNSKGEIDGDLILIRNTTNIEVYEEKYKNLYDKISEGIAIYSAVNKGEDFEFVDVNSAVEKFEGIKKKDIIGKKVTKVFPGVKKSGILSKFRKVYKTGKAESWTSHVYEDKRLGKSVRKNYVYKLPNEEIVVVYYVEKIIEERKEKKEGKIKKKNLKKKISKKKIIKKKVKKK